MYIPEQYQFENQEEIIAFLQRNSFGILVNQTHGTLWATHIPLEWDKKEDGTCILFGHVSKENPQWKSFESNADVLAIFNGPHSYISSSWYEKEEVPTWNYIAVHVYGKVSIIKGEAVIDSLRKLTDKYEQFSENPIRIDELSAKTMRQVNGIVAFEIEIERMEAVRKMSQNRNEKDFHNIITSLEKTGRKDAAEVAGSMKKNSF